MAINRNHLFEELDGVKCGIVEKDVSPGRLQFLKQVLEYNGYTVVAIPTPPPKAAPAPANTEGGPTTSSPPAPDTFTVGVTDTTFNPINAIFGRMLKTPDGQVVTLAYWQQQDKVSHDEIPYFEHQ